MPALPLFYCDHFDFPLPPGHRFPLAKYRMVRELLVADESFQLSAAPFVDIDDLLRVHTCGYVQAFLQGSLDRGMLRRIGFPWSEGLVRRTLASTGGTLAAAKTALQTGCAGTIAGGTHHAFRNAGAGYCVFNDLAVAIEWGKQCAGLQRIAAVDLDVHQGDGTANIFEGDERVFTLSLHGAGNFPFHKQRSRLDIELPDRADAAQYIPALQQGLEEVWQFAPQLILFQAGVDGLESDRLGRLSLMLEDLAVRDAMLFEGARSRSIPLVITMGGGYSEPIELTVEAHTQTYRIAAAGYAGGRVRKEVLKS